MMSNRCVYPEEVNFKDVYCPYDIKTTVKGGIVCTNGISDMFWTVFIYECNDGVVFINTTHNCNDAKIMHELTCDAIERGLDPDEFIVVIHDDNWVVVSKC